MKDGRLEVSDLMSGDLVDVRCDAAPNTPHIERITPAHFLRDEIWLPIPITKEILEKIGFEASKYFKMMYWSKSYDEFIKVSELEEGHLYLEAKGKKGRYEGDCNFLHELQHALRLCGITLNIDKKIEL